MNGSTGIQPSTVIPDSSTTAGHAVHRDAEEQVERHLAAVGHAGDLGGRVELAHELLAVEGDAPLLERHAAAPATPPATEGSARRIGITSAISDRSRSPRWTR